MYGCPVLSCIVLSHIAFLCVVWGCVCVCLFLFSSCCCWCVTWGGKLGVVGGLGGGLVCFGGILGFCLLGKCVSLKKKVHLLKHCISWRRELVVILCKDQDVIQVESGIFPLSLPGVGVRLFLRSVILFLSFWDFDAVSRFLTWVTSWPIYFYASLPTKYRWLKNVNTKTKKM